VSFTCIQCRTAVPQRALGTRHRNHCPACLYSRHVDDRIGDRAAACNGPMAPIAVAPRSGGEWQLVHQCRSCGKLRINRVAGDDDERALLALARQPLDDPPFPVELVEAWL
jgi:hypothetical protein